MLAMAKPKDGSGPIAEQSQGKGKSFKAETGSFDALRVNDSFTGQFIGAKWQEIQDVRTRQPKKIFVMKFRKDGDETERVYKFPCAAMMLQTWEDMVDEYGNGDEEEAIKRLRGRRMTINRGDDTFTKSSRNQLGTYEMIVWE